MSDAQNPSRDERIDQWINDQSKRKKKQRERQEKIIPASTEAITHGSVGDGLEALGHLSYFFGDHPELTGVEVLVVEPGFFRIIFFGYEAPSLPPAFELENAEANGFRLDFTDAMNLPTTGTRRGWQLEALASVGNFATSTDGSSGKLMYNTTGIKVLGFSGVEGFGQGMLLGTAVEHVVAEWSQRHHIWLCGFGEDAERVRAVSAAYHDDDYLHVVDSFAEVTAEATQDGYHTAYVMHSEPRDMLHFEQINGGNLAMISDDILNERAIYLTETYDGMADLVPDNRPMFPHVIMAGTEDYEVLEGYYQDYLRTQEAFENLSPEDFTDPAKSAGAPGVADEQIHSWMDQDTPTEPTEPEQTETVETEPAETEPAETEPAETEPAELGWQLALLGPVRFDTGDRIETSQPAELLAILHTHGEDELSGKEVSVLLWPEDDPVGNTARARRKRLTAKLREVAPGVVSTEYGGWVLAAEAVTDLSLITQAAQHIDLDQAPAILAQIDRPLDQAGPWADEHREQITAAVEQYLTAAEAAAGKELAPAIEQARERLHRTGQ